MFAVQTCCFCNGAIKTSASMKRRLVRFIAVPFSMSIERLALRYSPPQQVSHGRACACVCARRNRYRENPSGAMRPTNSEGELQAELDLARIGDSASNCGVRRDPLTQRGKELDTLLKSSRPVKVRVVEQVERLSAELDALVFQERDVFHKGIIEVRQARADDAIAPQVAISSGFG